MSAPVATFLSRSSNFRDCASTSRQQRASAVGLLCQGACGSSAECSTVATTASQLPRGRLAGCCRRCSLKGIHFPCRAPVMRYRANRRREVPAAPPTLPLGISDHRDHCGRSYAQAGRPRAAICSGQIWRFDAVGTDDLLADLFHSRALVTHPKRARIERGRVGCRAFKLYRAPWLDAFRRTLPGTLLLGRLFSARNLIAYAFAIAAGALADRAIRSRKWEAPTSHLHQPRKLVSRQRE